MQTLLKRWNSDVLVSYYRHLGHDITVHRQYYRLHESTLELAKVAKLLMAVDEGKAATLAGKGLDEISLEGKVS